MKDPTPALLLTRPEADSVAFLDELRSLATLGVVAISPILRIVPRGGLLDMKDVNAVIFSSANGVRAYEGPVDRTAFCVGQKTTSTARDRGFAAKFAGACAEELVATLIRRRPPGRLLHLRGAHARGDIASRLSKAGVRTEDAVIYDQRACPLTDTAHALLRGEAAVILPLFSPRSADIVAQQVEPTAPLWVVAISDAVAERARKLSPQLLRIAENPDAAAVCEAVAALYHSRSALEGDGSVP